MIKKILQLAALAGTMMAAGYAAIPPAQAADTVGTSIYSPTPQLFKPFEVKMHMTPKAMTVIHGDIAKMHKITCTLTGSSEGNDMAVFHCTPG